jgi:hypothetical protein
MADNWSLLYLAGVQERFLQNEDNSLMEKLLEFYSMLKWLFA